MCLPRLLLLSGIVVCVCGLAYLDQPPPAHTGGFGEKTCYQCHFDGELNEPGGTLELQGVPAHYVPGQTYTLSVQLARPALEHGGFQLSVRHAEGTYRGKQAGTFSSDGQRVGLSRKDAVQYLNHTEAGTAPQTSDSIEWTFAWKAPPVDHGPVVFHLAANAANGDASEFGDAIYTLEAIAPGPK